MIIFLNCKLYDYNFYFFGNPCIKLMFHRILLVEFRDSDRKNYARFADHLLFISFRSDFKNSHRTRETDRNLYGPD